METSKFASCWGNSFHRVNFILEFIKLPFWVILYLVEFFQNSHLNSLSVRLQHSVSFDCFAEELFSSCDAVLLGNFIVCDNVKMHLYHLIWNGKHLSYLGKALFTLIQQFNRLTIRNLSFVFQKLALSTNFWFLLVELTCN